MPDKSTAKAGSPILYYKANSRGSTIEQIYKFEDNMAIVNLWEELQGNTGEWYNIDPNNAPVFYGDGTTANMGYIQDPRTDIPQRIPYRRDSYLLISAGADGNYGTDDDIRNFGLE